MNGPAASGYPWLTFTADGAMHINLDGAAPPEIDRRLVIAQELRAGRLALAVPAGAERRDADLRDALRLVMLSSGIDAEIDTPITHFEDLCERGLLTAQGHADEHRPALTDAGRELVRAAVAPITPTQPS